MDNITYKLIALISIVIGGGLSTATLKADDSFDFIKISCQQGNLIDCVNLAELYRKGQKVSKDYDKAIYYYKQGCEGKIGQGCSGLGVMYDFGFHYFHNLHKLIHEKLNLAEDQIKHLNFKSVSIIAQITLE